MTQEEKARAHDEALERARKMLNMILDNELIGFPDQIREIFPQLRESESEDERIRRTLVEYFGPKVQLDFVRGVPIQKIRDWLEKQKEQKPVDYDHEMWKNCEANFEGGKKEVIEHPEKYGLQKPAEWSKSDIKVKNVLALTPVKPIFGHKSGKSMGTHWICFMKEEKNESKTLETS